MRHIASMNRVPIGRLLVEAGTLTEAQVEAVADAQRTQGGRFCSIALSMGYADERALVRTLSRQLGVPALIVTEVHPEPQACALLPREAAERHVALPARVFNRTLTLLMRDPTDAQAISDLQFLTGKVIRPLIALEAPLRRAIDAHYARMADAPLPPSPHISRPPEPVVPETPAAPVEPVSMLDELFTPHYERAVDVDSNSADARPRLLCVDDDASILRLYEGIFPPSEFRVFTCSDGVAAVELVRRLRPHVVLLDGRLPGMHGFEVCRRIKQDPDLAATAVLLLSGAYRGWQMRADLMSHCGADDVIEKPFAIDHVAARVGDMVRAARVERQTGTARILGGEAVKHLNAGLMMLQKGELDAAAAEFKRCVAEQPFAARPHFYLGKIHERRDERYDAMFEYEQAIALDATFFPAVKDLALLYQQAGFVQKAVEMWHQALAICPDATMRQTIKDHLLRLI